MTLGGVVNMQEKFALRKTLKKVAAVGTSLAMVGITVSGALAAGLGDYPSPFNKTASQTVVVWGADADNAAVQDVLAGLPGGASTTYTLGGTVEGALTLDDFEQGERDDVDVGTPVDDSLGLQLDETDAVGLTEFNVAVDIGLDTDYDAHEVIEFTDDAVELTTALDQGQEDFDSGAFLSVPDESFSYRVDFEEDMDDGNRFDDATDDDAITVPFLGKNLVVTDAPSATSITAYAGDKVRLKIGDTVQSSGKTVRLDGVDDDSALLTVDGEADSVDEGDRERINDVEIYVDDVFNSDDDANDQALVIVQGGSGQAVETYENGEEFVDENEDHYLWEWDLAGLTGATPTLGITLHEDLSDPETDEFESEIMDLGLLRANKAYLAEGDYLCLPYRYACLVLEGQDGDMSWNDVTLDIDDSEDLDAEGDGDTDLADASVLEVSISGVGSDRGFTALDVDTGADSTVGDFSTFWLYYDPTAGAGAADGVVVYYEDPDTGAAFALDLDNDGTFPDAEGDEAFDDDDGDVILDGEDVDIVRFDIFIKKAYLNYQEFNFNEFY